MPKKKHSKQKKKFSGKSVGFSFDLGLSDNVKNIITSIFLIFISILFIMAFFGLAGEGGNFILKGGLFLLGKLFYLLPFLLLAYSFFIIKNQKLEIFEESNAKVNFIGFIVLFISFTGIFGSIGFEDKNGGILGYALSFPLIKIFSVPVVFVFFTMLFFVGVAILLRGSLIELLQGKRKNDKKKIEFKKVFEKKFKIKELPAIQEIKSIMKQAGESQAVSRETPPLSKAGDNGNISIEINDKLANKKFKELAGKLPPLDLLEKESGRPESGDIKINSAIIKRTLQNFNIPVEMGEVNIGPSVTQYTLRPAEGVKLSRISALSNDLALALAAPSVRIEAPIPGKSLVGIEVPNLKRHNVRLRDLLDSDLFQGAVSNLIFALGRDVSGAPIFADLKRMPHLLVAGSTGSGKTICINAIILSFLYKNTPETLRFIMIDPKRVELSLYNDIPHLLCPTILDPNKALASLKWLIGEMERRFTVLGSVRKKDIASYNEFMKKKKKETMPYIVCVIDEMADLMAIKGKELEAGIIRLAQMARAVGIHLILATQRPSVNVITGLIKANITSRIAFKVASQVDSRTILDTSGAEKLLGRGDMLFITNESPKPKRLQGTYVSEKEVKKVVDWYIENYALEDFAQEEGLKQELEKNDITQYDISGSLGQALEGGGDFGVDEDPLLEEAKRVVVEAGKASASLLQRRLRIGYARAARLIDILEQKGIVGPAEGAKPRDVLVGGFSEEQDMNNGDGNSDKS